MPTTSNFGWTTPADTDLVKDGAAAIRTLGNGIDTSLVDLKGGTTGQILSKNSNTDLDYTWINNDQGDITAVTAGTGITGGGSSGAVTITNDMATTLTTKGDILVATGSGTYARLGVGSNNSTIVADSSTSTGLKWAAPAGGGKVLQVVSTTYSTSTTIASTSFTDTGLSLAITPSAATSKVLVLVDLNLNTSRSAAGFNTYGQIVRASTAIYETHLQEINNPAYSSGTNSISNRVPLTYLDSPNTTSSTTYKVQVQCGSTGNSQQSVAQYVNEPSSITLLEIGA